ncbi:MAG: alkaline phosphatase family protein [Pantoea sp.]|uniref:alkaline phosphatase family protein n=1 Tax=Pantoea sp. TaxID=69393 RepID=UPI0023A1D3D2|nr:alkaline phosphatase family protein [Pantoea sp.]MDE1186282.1 alkaline phosphatase family protein [Pantoea sp.]
MTLKLMSALLAAGVAGLTTASAATAADQPHNVILFVADGLRSPVVDDTTAPNMAAIARNGVYLRNSHSLFPTFTTANASAMATGHMLGDTGDFSNTIYTGFQVPGAGKSLTPFLESDPVLGDVDEHFSGNYLNEATILQLAREKGFWHRLDRQARPGADLRPYRADRRKDGADRRFDRDRKGHSAVGRNPGAAEGGRPAAGDPGARPERQIRRFPDRRHQIGQHHPAGLFRRRRHPRRAAGTGRQAQALRHGLLVARPRRHAA